MKPYENYGDKRNITVKEILNSTLTDVTGARVPNDAIKNINLTWQEEVADDVKESRVGT